MHFTAHSLPFGYGVDTSSHSGSKRIASIGPNRCPLELNSKDIAGFFNERNTKTGPHYNAEAPGSTLPYQFFHKAQLLQGIGAVGTLQPPLYYDFPNPDLGKQGILSRNPIPFRFLDGKLVLANKAVGLGEPVKDFPVQAIVVNQQQGLDLAVEHQIGSDKLTLRFDDGRLTFLGPKFYSGERDVVTVGFNPSE